VLGFIAEDGAYVYPAVCRSSIMAGSAGRASWRGLRVERRGGACRKSVVAGSPGRRECGGA